MIYRNSYCTDFLLTFKMYWRKIRDKSTINVNNYTLLDFRLNLLTCGKKAIVLSPNVYSLLVAKIPTTSEGRPDKPSLLLRPTSKEKKFIYLFFYTTYTFMQIILVV